MQVLDGIMMSFAGVGTPYGKVGPSRPVELPSVPITEMSLRTARGSGSTEGVIELNANVKSSKAFINSLTFEGKDFIFDHTTERFAISGRNVEGIKHYGLRKIIGAAPENVVGGRIRFKEGKIEINQWSGTYGEQWTSEKQNKLEIFMFKMTKVPINYSRNQYFNDGTH